MATNTETDQELCKIIAEQAAEIAELRADRDAIRVQRDAARAVLAEFNEAAAEQAVEITELRADRKRLARGRDHARRERDAARAELSEPRCPSCDNETAYDGCLCDDCAEDACPGCGAMPEEPHNRCTVAGNA